MSKSDSIQPDPAEGMPPRLAIVIVNYRSAELTVNALRSLAPEVMSISGGADVIVVDGASGDGSVEAISNQIAHNRWSSWACVLPLTRNGGFAAGNNAAIQRVLARPAPPRYILLLNPDTLVRAAALQALVEFLDAHPRVGIAGSRMEYPDGQVQHSTFRFPTLLSECEQAACFGPLTRLLARHALAPPIPASSVPCQWVSGASMCVRREVFEQVGLMDEGYFLYYEEVDFCLRAHKAGWETWYVPQSRVVHLIGQSTGITQIAKRRPAYWYESRRRFFLLHRGVGKLLLADLFWVASRPVVAARRLLKGATVFGNDPKWFLRDLVFGDLKAVLSGDARRVVRAKGQP